jgi:hypothetical protein
MSDRFRFFGVRPTRLILVILSCASWLGCSGGGVATYRVTGTATFDGDPIAEGDIIFLSVDNSTPPGAGKIQGGTFKAEVPAGQKKVEIRASRMEPLPEGQTGAMGETEMAVDYIPARYNSETELTAEVKEGGNNEFSFALTSE